MGVVSCLVVSCRVVPCRVVSLRSTRIPAVAAAYVSSSPDSSKTVKHARGLVRSGWRDFVSLRLRTTTPAAR